MMKLIKFNQQGWPVVFLVFFDEMDQLEAARLECHRYMVYLDRGFHGPQQGLELRV